MTQIYPVFCLATADPFTASGLCLFEGESHCNIAQAGLKLKNVLPQTPKACTTIPGYYSSLRFITYILIYVYYCTPA